MVHGQGNIRGEEGPRNAVATGLAISYKEVIMGVDKENFVEYIYI